MRLSRPQALLIMHLVGLQVPKPELEHRFHPIRRWRHDLSWPELMIAAECDGGTWTRGRHTRGLGYQADCEKRNAATEAGWRVFNYTTGMIESGEAARQLQRVISGGGKQQHAGEQQEGDGGDR